MKNLLITFCILIGTKGATQELKVLYTEKRKPTQVEYKEDLGEIIDHSKILELLSKVKDIDSARNILKVLEDSTLVIRMKSRKQLEGKLDIPFYDYITILDINRQESIYYPEQKITNDTASVSFVKSNGDSLSRRKVHFYDTEIIYTDFKATKMVTAIKKYSFDRLARSILIEETLPKFTWVMSNESKVIAGYPCKKATLLNSERPVDAWYTEQINVSNGPKEYYGLPGLILEIKEGDEVITAEKVMLFPVDNIKIEIPATGDKMTREQFENLEAKIFNEW